MKYIEDDFELKQYKRPPSIVEPINFSDGGEAVRFSGLPKPLNYIVSALVWLASLALAFAAAYYLYRGGQYLIDMIMKMIYQI